MQGPSRPRIVLITVSAVVTVIAAVLSLSPGSTDERDAALVDSLDSRVAEDTSPVDLMAAEVSTNTAAGPERIGGQGAGPSDARDISRDIIETLAKRRNRSLHRAPAFKLTPPGAPLTLKPVPQPADPFTFQVGTLNVLGSQHTLGNSRFGPGVARTARAVDMFAARGMDIVGLQEVQDDQLGVLYNRLGGFEIWPGRALGNNGVRLQIAYRTELFELVDTGSIGTRFDFQTRPIPYVLLRNRATGGEFYVVTIHNSPRTQEADRDSATAAEIALFNQLRATGRPVLVTGDMNEKEEWFCKVATGAGMVAANGGSGAGGCVLPPGPLRIDWIMGGDGVDFSGYVQDGASLAGITDHWFVRSDVTVTPTNLVLPEN